MKKIAIAALFLLASTLPASALQEGDKAPDFSLPLVQSQKALKLSDYKGKVVLVNFWATWCPPCRAEIPGFIKVYEKNKKKGFVILGLSVDKEGPSTVAPFLKKNKVSYPVAMADSKSMDAYGGIRAIPTSFLLDKKGRIAKSVVGEFAEADLQKAIEPLLK